MSCVLDIWKADLGAAGQGRAGLSETAKLCPNTLWKGMLQLWRRRKGKKVWGACKNIPLDLRGGCSCGIKILLSLRGGQARRQLDRLQKGNQ